LEGVIGVWDVGQNFGWILCSLGRVFVHVTDAPDNKPIPVGTKVKFEVTMNRMLQKKKAIRVKILPEGYESSDMEEDETSKVDPQDDENSKTKVSNAPTLVDTTALKKITVEKVISWVRQNPGETMNKLASSITIPYKALGHNKLRKFIYTIPEIRLAPVAGNSCMWLLFLKSTKKEDTKDACKPQTTNTMSETNTAVAAIPTLNWNIRQHNDVPVGWTNMTAQRSMPVITNTTMVSNPAPPSPVVVQTTPIAASTPVSTPSRNVTFASNAVSTPSRSVTYASNAVSTPSRSVTNPFPINASPTQVATSFPGTTNSTPTAVQTPPTKVIYPTPPSNPNRPLQYPANKGPAIVYNSNKPPHPSPTFQYNIPGSITPIKAPIMNTTPVTPPRVPTRSAGFMNRNIGDRGFGFAVETATEIPIFVHSTQILNIPIAVHQSIIQGTYIEFTRDYDATKKGYRALNVFVPRDHPSNWHLAPLFENLDRLGWEYPQPPGIVNGTNYAATTPQAKSFPNPPKNVFIMPKSAVPPANLQAEYKKLTRDADVKREHIGILLSMNNKVAKLKTEVGTRAVSQANRSDLPIHCKPGQRFRYKMRYVGDKSYAYNIYKTTFLNGYVKIYDHKASAGTLIQEGDVRTFDFRYEHIFRGTKLKVGDLITFEMAKVGNENGSSPILNIRRRPVLLKSNQMGTIERKEKVETRGFGLVRPQDGGETLQYWDEELVNADSLKVGDFVVFDIYQQHQLSQKIIYNIRKGVKKLPRTD